MFAAMKSRDRLQGADFHAFVHEAGSDHDTEAASLGGAAEPDTYRLSKSARQYCSLLLLTTDLLAVAAVWDTLTYAAPVSLSLISVAAAAWAGVIAVSRLATARTVTTARDVLILARNDSLVCAALFLAAALTQVLQGAGNGRAVLVSLSVGCATLVAGRLATVAASTWCRAYWVQHVLLIGTAQALARQLRNQPAERAQPTYAGAILIGGGTVELPLLGRLAVPAGAADSHGSATVEPGGLISGAAIGCRQTRQLLGRVDRFVLLEEGLGADEKRLALAWLERFSHEVHVLQSQPPHAKLAACHDGGVLAKPATMQPLGSCLKRVLDVVLALTALLVLLPALLIVAILIRMESNGPALFRQPRLGCDNLPFTVFKFRTMRQNGAADGSVQAVRGDSRVTRLGAILRKTSIDELPQLLNVLNGSMSLVGPRPHPLTLNSRFEPLISSYAARHSVLPGITGWAQINGARGETPTVEAMQRRVDLDLEYVRRQSILLDLWILCRTVLSVVQARNVY